MIYVFSINVSVSADNAEARRLAEEAEARVKELVGVLTVDASTPIDLDLPGGQPK